MIIEEANGAQKRTLQGKMLEMQRRWHVGAMEAYETVFIDFDDG